MNIILARRTVDNPSLTEGLARGEKPERYLKETVWENRTERLGAYAELKDLEQYEERAIEWFRIMYQRAYGGTVGAVDCSRVQVDTSILGHDGGAAARVDASTDIRRAIEHLGKEAADRQIAHAFLAVSFSSQVDVQPNGKPNVRQRGKLIQSCRDDLSILADWLGLKSRGA